MIKDTQVDYLREKMDIFNKEGDVIRYEEILREDKQDRITNEGWDWKAFRFNIRKWIDDKSYYLIHKDPQWKIYYCADRKLFEIHREEKSWVIGNDRRVTYSITQQTYIENKFIMDIIFRDIDRRIYML
jgi:hypothetical protein